MKISINSTQNKEVIDITEEIDKLLSDEKIDEGIVLIFVKHSTAAIAISEVGEGTESDLLSIVQKIIPQINFKHGHNPYHAPDHMISSIVGPSLTVPVAKGKLDLGTWQKVVLLELNGPRKLELTIAVITN